MSPQIPPSYADAGFSMADVDAISQALGTPVADLPPVQSLSADQLQLLKLETPQIHAQVSTYIAEVTNPLLELPKVVLDSAKMAMLLAELNKVIGELAVESTREGIAENRDKKNEIHQKNLAKIKEAAEKQAKAEKKEKRKKIWGWIGAVVGVVAAVAACVATGGAAAPLVFAAVGLVCAVASVTVMALEESGAMEKMMLATCRKRGYSEEETQKYMQKVRMAITVTVAVVGLTAGLGGGVAALRSTASLATTAMKVSGVIGTIGDLTEAGAAVGEGVTTFQASKARVDSMNAMADSKELEAWMKKLQAVLEEETDELMAIMEKLNKMAFDDPKKILDSVKQTYDIVASEQMVSA